MKTAKKELETVTKASVTTPQGFTAGAAKAKVRTDWDKLDVALLYSEAPCVTAAVYTSNRLKAAPVLITQQHLTDGKSQAVVANAGCANAATGKQGMDNAIRMAQLAGEKLGIDPHDVIVASTGVIGSQLPMDRIAAGIEETALVPDGGLDFARAIMTTDTKPKYTAVRANGWSVGGVVKGVGMIHPNMATMLCFITTDAPVTRDFLQSSLKEAVDSSFNLVDVDSDTSTNDIAVVMANGIAGGPPLDASHPDAGLFQAALTEVCTSLARMMVSDAEGGTKVIEARVGGARSAQDARAAAREIVRSLGVKTMVYGHDPNWGRVLAAVGNSGAEFDLERTALWVVNRDGDDICFFREGAPQPYDLAAARACFQPREVAFRVDLAAGEASATAWGSDLTEEFVRLNSLYTT